jgi:hypothetical protein
MTLALPTAAGAGRIVAVGDIHGSFDGLTSILQEAGIIDENLKWTGGTDTYIQLGDLFDRGVKVREVVDLVMRLQGEAAAAGGRVECILGNHETMNLTGFYRDSNPEIYSTFVDSKSEKRRNKLWNSVKDYRDLRDQPTDDLARQGWMDEHPIGWLEYTQALGSKGVYGTWLRTLPTAIMIGDVLFIHGGVSPSVVGMTVDEINAAVAEEIKTFDRARQYLVAQSLVPPTASFAEIGEMVRAIIYMAEQEDSTDIIRRHAEQLEPMAGIDSWLMVSPDGPLWFRGAARWDEELRGDEMAMLLDGIGAKTMVVGHTPDPDGTIRVRFSDRVFVIDTGMLSSYYENGRPSALEISGDVYTAIYLDGEREILRGSEPLDKAAATTPRGPTVVEQVAALR